MLPAVRGFFLAACIGIVVSAGGPALGAGQGDAHEGDAHEGEAQLYGSIDFNIPAQPLASALVAYGAATGLEVYYDGALAVGRNSAALEGSFTPVAGLETLLRGTGFQPRAMGPGVFTLVAAAPQPPAAPAPTRVSDALIRQYEPYFGALQARVVDALCGIDTGQRVDTGRPKEIISKEIVFSLSVDPSGVISRAAILGSSGDPARDAAISAGLSGLRIGKAPPPGLPQPVTLAVYPPAAGEVPGCTSTDIPRTER